MGDDRLDWIFEGDSPESLESRYDTWAVTYDADHDQWGWRGPDMVAEVTVRHIGAHDDTATIIDAGCGTGKVGIALRSAGWTGRLTGLDLSQGMLDVAAMSGVYDELVKCSLYEIPLPDDHSAAAVSSGVFTHGHVGGEAFVELCRVTRPGGVVTVTQRVDMIERFEPHVRALSDEGRWLEIERSTPQLFHPERDDTEQIVITWQTLPRTR